MVSSGSNAFGTQQNHEVIPESGLELTAPVSGDCGRSAESGYPALEECSRHCFCGDVWEGKGFQPAGEPVYDSQEVCVAIGVGEWSYQVKVDGVEPSTGRCKSGEWSSSVFVHFCSLAAEACLSPLSDIAFDVGPYESRSDESLSGFHAWV